MRNAMPDRDASWGRRTYYAFGNEGPLDRLIRRAARGPYSESPDDVLRLAGTLIAWTFTSPNRFMRDYATKALRQLLETRPAVLEQLVRQFAECDDMYVIERLAIVAHGSLLTAGDQNPDGALTLARAVRDCFLKEERAPNFLVRDAVRGSFEWALRRGLIERSEYNDVCPPYGSSPPDKPRTKKQLERAYDRHKRDRKGNYIPSPYGRLFISLFDLGDFGRYVVESKLSRFTDLRLSQPIPQPRKPKPCQAKWEEFIRSLPQALQSAPDIETLIAGLSHAQLREMRAIIDPPAPAPLSRTRRYPAELGRCWIFERVLSLGWTPARFAEFESTYLRERGRDSHKGERFGKKYQWIALRELVARVADNFHMTGEWSDDERLYQGPWQFYGRDIDPTLPPPPRYRDTEDDVIRVGPTFESDPPSASWDPGGPRYLASDPPPTSDWASQTDDVPSFDVLVRRTDPDGGKWIVLQGYFNWDEEQIGRDDWRRDRPRRDLWSHIYSWLVAADELNSLVGFLSNRSFMGRWMPEAGEITNDAYLAEMPWAAAASEYPREWRPVSPRHEGGGSAFEVFPAWEHYTWEGGGLDCSIEDTVGASLPAVLLFGQQQLEWVPGTRNWRDTKGAVVAQHRSRTGEHNALLVRESWLKAALRKGGWGLVIGWLGEKMLLSGSLSPGLIGEWTELNGVGSFDHRGFKSASTSLKQVSERTDGREEPSQ